MFVRCAIETTSAVTNTAKRRERLKARATARKPTHSLEWPREESNLRTQIRSLLLYPLSYGASGRTVARLLRGALGAKAVSYVRCEHGDDGWIELRAGEALELLERSPPSRAPAGRGARTSSP